MHVYWSRSMIIGNKKKLTYKDWQCEYMFAFWTGIGLISLKPVWKGFPIRLVRAIIKGDNFSVFIFQTKADKINPSDFKDLDWLFPDTTKHFNKLPLQYRVSLQFLSFYNDM